VRLGITALRVRMFTAMASLQAQLSQLFMLEVVWNTMATYTRSLHAVGQLSRTLLIVHARLLV
jgi:hypothetical protein